MTWALHNPWRFICHYTKKPNQKNESYFSEECDTYFLKNVFLGGVNIHKNVKLLATLFVNKILIIYELLFTWVFFLRDSIQVIWVYRIFDYISGYDIKPGDGVAPVLELWGMWSTPSLQLLPVPPWPIMVVPVRFPSIGQIELGKYLLFMKAFNWLETNELWLI